jgi:ABC-type transport system substrate-binding protein
VLLTFGVTLWSADLAIGTWKLNTAKSKYHPGSAPKSATITYEETADGIKRTGESIDADGNKTSFEYTAKYDGKDYPVSGSELFDAIALTRFNDQTVEIALKKSVKVVTTARRFVPKDGKTMKFTISGTNGQGQAGK